MRSWLNLWKKPWRRNLANSRSKKRSTNCSTTNTRQCTRGPQSSRLTSEGEMIIRIFLWQPCRTPAILLLKILEHYNGGSVRRRTKTRPVHQRRHIFWLNKILLLWAGSNHGQVNWGLLVQINLHPEEAVQPGNEGWAGWTIIVLLHLLEVPCRNPGHLLVVVG